MKTLNLQDSIQVLKRIQHELASDFGHHETLVIGYTDQRALEIINNLGEKITATDKLAAADVYLNLDANQDTIGRIAETYDIPVVTYDISDTLLAWEDHSTYVKNKAIENIAPVVTHLLHHLDPNSVREGLADTPKRVAKAWAKWTEGYHMDAKDLLKVFEDGAEKCDEMVIVKDIPIYSHCEHHLAAIFGTATIAYIPNGKIVGLSKLSRLADMFARRLQVQERLTNQIADALEEHLQPLGVGVIIKARHMCMESRGICQQGHHTITSALRGNLRDNTDSRAEFMALANASNKPQ